MGFTFNAIHSDIYNIAASIRSRPLIPEKRQYDEYVIGKDGRVHVEDGYEDAMLEIECHIGDYDRAARRTNARGISTWLRATPPVSLIFDDEPGMIYTVMAVVNNASLHIDGWLEDFTLSFRCKPYQTKTHKFPVQTITGADTIAVTNSGNYKALPVFTLAGTATTITIDTFTYTGLAGTVYIDCENHLVYSGTGESKVNEIANFSGDFLELAPGLNNLAVSGTITSVDVTTDYWDTYL